MSESESEAASKKEIEEPGTFQIIILILSVYVLIVFAIQTFVHDLSPETNEILDGMDLVVCIFFLWDFFFRLWNAPSKLEFMKWGWIDFISSIPILLLPVSNHVRFLRIVRLFRILRAFRSTKIIAHFLFLHRARTGVVSVILVSFLVAVFAAIAVLNFETSSPDSNIKTSEDALWWSFSTITTVACEKYPVTEGGRAVALFLMATGVCLFGCITAYIATVFLEPLQKTEESEVRQVLDEIRLLREKVDALETSNQRLLSQKE